MEAGCESWPNTKAISWRNNAEGSEKPAARAWTAEIDVGRFGGEARSLRANIALYLSKSGRVVSSNRDCNTGIDVFCVV